MPSGLAWLKGLSEGANSLGSSINEREMLKEQRKRQQIADALAMLKASDEYGLEEIQGDPQEALKQKTLAQLGSLKPNVSSLGGPNMAASSGGPDLDEQRREQLQYGKPSTVNIGERSFLRDPSQGRSAREAEVAWKKLLEGERIGDERAGAQQKASYTQAMDLANFNAKNRPGNFGNVTTKAGIFAQDRNTGKLGERIGDRPPPQGSARQGVLRPPTEGQEKSYIFHGLMQSGEKEVNDAWATGKVRPAAITAFLRAPGIADAGVNAFLNPEEQKYIRGLRSFTAGALRKETGAAFGKQELSEQHGRYFAGFGDSPEMAEPKQKARREYIEMMGNSALPAANYYRVMKGGAVPTMNPDNPEEPSDIVDGGKPSLADRVAQLKAQGVSREQAKALLRTEGYKVP